MSNTIYPNPESGNLKLFSRGNRAELVALDIWRIHKAL